MKDILLIQPLASFNNSRPVLPQDSVGIGMLTIMAYLKQFGVEGEVIHIPRALSTGYTLDNVFERIKEANPKLIAISLNWLHFSEGALQLASMLREMLPNTTIVIGGQHATLFAEEILECSSDIDGITVGESERTFYYLIKELKRGNRKIPKGIPGVMINDPIDGIVGSVPEIIEDLDTLPFYTYRDVWPYADEVCAALDTVRGECLRKCSYCIESKTNYLQGRKKFTYHSMEYLAKQIKFFVSEGTNNITIQDSFYLLGDKKIQELCQCLKKEGIKLNILNIFVEPTIFEDETLIALKEVANKVSLDYGMETGSAETAELIGRRYDKDKLLEGLKKTSEMGIKILTWWMTGLPIGKTQLPDYKRTVLKENMDYIDETIKCGTIPRWITPLILFPHTDMAKNNDYYGIKPYIKTFKEFCAYSRVEANNYGVYYDLLTHETAAQNRREIIESTIALKKAVLDKVVEYRDILLSYGWTDLELEAFKNEAMGSFY
ncbi:radical SAM protein [Acetivibrio clariflavus]|uniref:B12-binding domain-containing radical SAM protein n=1 Tax=Acetivibrio clariflavus TaxID=288965 RepID=UPI0031F4A326